MNLEGGNHTYVSLALSRDQRGRVSGRGAFFFFLSEDVEEDCVSDPRDSAFTSLVAAKLGEEQKSTEKAPSLTSRLQAGCSRGLGISFMQRSLATVPQ
ncbi:hypothetical protein HPB50_022714 [Hyalomma asiaticum]|uniref:Uncharacterized protein n=1 Tax=Hyalomma asiaticum TaxID=266040 RepID=A0ACB7S8Y2_HYAAI|nr:hypothetical protein HPB50_022714 [Hyalomma asiaticum]